MASRAAWRLSPAPAGCKRVVLADNPPGGHHGPSGYDGSVTGDGIMARTLDVSGGRCEDEEPAPRPTGPDEAGYQRWLAARTERLDPLMAVLSISFALLVAFQLAQPDLSRAWRRNVDWAILGIWAAFVAEFLLRFAAAPARGRFLRRHWLALLMLVVPALRFLRLAALVRVGRALPAARVVSSSYRAAGTARRLTRSRVSFLASAAGLATLAIAELAWLFERGRGTFVTFGDALIWAATVVVSLQGDPTPESVGGRLVMLAGFALGLVLVATLAATFGAYLLEDRRERAEAGD